MKLFKRLLALTLAMFSLLTLASCDKVDELLGDESKEKAEEITIIADWKGEIAYMNFASSLLANGDDAMADAISKLDLNKHTVKSTISFKDDSTYTMSLDSESMNTSINAFVEALLTEVYNATFANSEAAMTLDEYIAASKSALTQLFPNASALTINGKYKLDGDKLYTTSVVTDEIDESAYLIVSLSADKLEFKDVVGESPMLPKEFLPATFTKA